MGVRAAQATREAAACPLDCAKPSRAVWCPSMPDTAPRTCRTQHKKMAGAMRWAADLSGGGPLMCWRRAAAAPREHRSAPCGGPIVVSTLLFVLSALACVLPGGIVLWPGHWRPCSSLAACPHDCQHGCRTAMYGHDRVVLDLLCSSCSAIELLKLWSLRGSALSPCPLGAVPAGASRCPSCALQIWICYTSPPTHPGVPVVAIRRPTSLVDSAVDPTSTLNQPPNTPNLLKQESCL